jgi:hypothetical protein
MWRWVWTVVVTLAALAIVRPAGAAPGMLVGARDDGLKWTTGPTVAVARDLGLRALGITLGWQPGQVDLFPNDANALNRAVVQAGDIRVVVAIFTNQGQAPVDQVGREQYCTYVGRLITRFPQINDVVIWNEPNLRFFWRPQYDGAGASQAPARYVELLARCWDVLHELRPSVNVVAPATSVWGNDNPNAFSNVSHSPGMFIKGMGAAYRASGRTRPLFDTFGHHPYPARSNERPWATHSDEQIVSLGDIDRFLGLLREAFDGTGQRLPEDGLPIWYLETGYQTQIDEQKQGLYSGVETWPGSLPDFVPQAPAVKPPDESPAPDQATQLADTLRMTYCQPYISAVFNFLLRDETNLEGWQSGVLWADGSRKDSYDTFRSVVREVNEGRVDCKQLEGAPGVPGGPSTKARVADAPTVARSLTKVTYRGGKVVPYGFLQPRAQLTRGLTARANGLAGKQLLFVVGGTGYVRLTDAAGAAAVTPMPPAKPGRYRLAVRFAGDPVNLASGLRVGVRVVNSKGRVRTVGPIRLARGLEARLSASSQGRKVQGTLTLRGRGPARLVRLTALGFRADARALWANGTDGTKRYLLHAERVPGRPLFRLRVWRDGVQLVRPALVPARQLRISGTR